MIKNMKQQSACPGLLCFFLLAVLISTQPLAAQDFAYPLAIAVASDGVIYVADRGQPGRPSRIWQVESGKRTVYFEGQAKLRTPLNAPWSLAIDTNGRLLVGDSATREVYRFNAERQPEPLTAGGIGLPMGIAVLKSGELLVSDLELHCIWRVPQAGGQPAKFAEVPSPTSLALDQQQWLWVVSRGADPVLRVSPEGKVEVVHKGREPFGFPNAVVVDKESNAYISDGYAHAIWKLAPDGKLAMWVEGEPLVNPVGLAWQGETLLVADPHAQALFQVDREGKLTPLETTAANTTE